MFLQTTRAATKRATRSRRRPCVASSAASSLQPAVDVCAIDVELQGARQRGGVALVLVAMLPPYFFGERGGGNKKESKIVNVP